MPKVIYIADLNLHKVHTLMAGKFKKELRRIFVTAVKPDKIFGEVYSKFTPDWQDELLLNKGEMSISKFSNNYQSKLRKLNPNKIYKTLQSKDKITIIYTESNTVGSTLKRDIKEWLTDNKFEIKELGGLDSLENL